MKKLTLVSLAVYLLGVTACTEGTEKTDTIEKKDSSVTTTASTGSKDTPPMDSAAKMKAWMDYMTPGEQHKMLAASDGKWKTETTMWMEPGKPPSVSVGEAENKMVYGGRYQRSVHKGNFDGMPFEGEGLVAYDNAKKAFVSTWVDNMGTGIMQMEGPWDEGSKSMTLKGVCTDPMTGKKMEMREVYKIIDDKNHSMEMFMTQDGKEMKTMEMKMTKI